MENNIISADIKILISFLKNNKKRIFTQSDQVKKFENQWSKWLGVKYSVFVNSGSSANLLTMQILKILYGSGEIIVPPLTWISDIASVLQNNLTPVFADIDPKSLCMDEREIIKKINKKTLAVFLTNAKGFNGLSENLLKILKKKQIILIVDVCVFYGVVFNV